VNGTTLYGTAEQDGPFNGGTVFRLNTDGSGFRLVRAFGLPLSDGALPDGGLVMSGRTLYGTTAGGGISSAQFMYGNGVIFGLSLPVTPPSVSCPAPLVLECTNHGATATLVVNLRDLSEDSVTVVWKLDGTEYQTNVVPSGSALTSTNLTLTADFGPGKHEVSVSASNGETAPVTCSTTVEVRDTKPPEIVSLLALPDVLSPPNHRLAPVTIRAEALDQCGPTACRILAVSSNEPIDEKRGPDWSITGDLSLELRAERLGRGQDRIYTVVIKCEDAAGNCSLGSVAITVPHQQAGGPARIGP
jgi:uncharacterized repeat protein (TIGR03803 family)